ncbi:Putative cell wall protein [Apostasia shenzhenica]|uniref:Cell wall protein n=1 Tax=Apostasia shenzhenica TaxID=1088818 RepID=A0A2H9ZX79_9ASPA|nr:Putative cell wall protein [Apostasia shenzhenica]
MEEMASGRVKCCLCILIILIITSISSFAVARFSPAAYNEKEEKDQEKKEVDVVVYAADKHEGSFLIPGIGRYMVGSHQRPSIIGLDRSGPAAAHARYLPGNDDTFVPNPGYEVPNPSNGGTNVP